MKNLLRKIFFKIRRILSTESVLIFPESRLAHRYCVGKGIEIGGSAHNPFGLDTLNIDRFDSTNTSFKRAEKRLCGRSLPVDIVSAGDCLPLADESQDFVVNSHVIEHFADPIRTLMEWDRVVKPMGILFMIVPHKERTFDAVRERTTLAHLIDDFYTNAKGPAEDEHGHYHVWITEDFLELINYMISELKMGWILLKVEDRDDKVGNGFLIVIRKIKSRTDRSLTKV
ncbi:MAG: methyltransferase domain-containing protein [Desulfobacteraceae bacterium]|nr:methyltransferase domain-containing protein [Desulfobacteraceae bacterium]